VREVHTTSGHHVIEKVPFPDWVPANVRTAARKLDRDAALAKFAAWID
jgi:hypothetical protein